MNSKSSDRMKEDSGVHVSKRGWRRGGGEYCSQIGSWHPAIVLAKHQSPDGQLAINSGQVDAYQSSLTHSSSSDSCFSASLCASGMRHSFAGTSESRDPPLGPTGADGIPYYVNVCVMMLLLALPTSSQGRSRTASFCVRDWH